MKEIMIVEMVEDDWDKVPKNQVCVLAKPDATRVWFATGHEHLKFFLSVVLGSRGGLKEEIVLVDSSRRTVADRLLLSEVNSMIGRTLPLSEMRKANKGIPHQGKVQALVSYMKTACADAQTNPETFFRETNLPHLGLVSASVATMSGGAWGLGGGH